MEQIFGKCGGRCINQVVQSLIKTLSIANNSIKLCRGSTDAECVSKAYGEASINTQALIGNAANCLSGVGVNLQTIQVARITARVVVSVIEVVQAEATASWNIFPFT